MTQSIEEPNSPSEAEPNSIGVPDSKELKPLAIAATEKEPVPELDDLPESSSRKHPTRSEAMRPLLVGRDDLAELLSISIATVDRYDSAGLLPESIRISGRVFFRVAEIESWVNEGCPKRSEWSKIWAARQTRK